MAKRAANVSSRTQKYIAYFAVEVSTQTDTRNPGSVKRVRPRRTGRWRKWWKGWKVARNKWQNRKPVARKNSGHSLEKVCYVFSTTPHVCVCVCLCGWQSLKRHFSHSGTISKPAKVERTSIASSEPPQLLYCILFLSLFRLPSLFAFLLRLLPVALSRR